MSYGIVFVDSKNRELVVKASETRSTGAETAAIMEFRDDAKKQVALAPITRISCCVEIDNSAPG